MDQGGGPQHGLVAEEWERLPVLGAKFAAPRLPSYVVQRPRLAKHLARPDWRVAVITGGPGAGKTVAALQHFESMAGARRAWITLDSDDDHPRRFWLHFGSALRRAIPEHFAGAGTFPPLRRTGERSSPAADVIMNAASVGDPLLIVLDQLDGIHDLSILGELEALVEALPTSVQLILTSRVDPPLPIARWRARSWLLELRQGELAFTADETKALFAASGEGRLSDGDISLLASRTEGWVAALCLALMSMKNRDDPAGVAQTFSGRNRMIADLLVSEVLDQQSEEDQQFLLRTSIARHLDSDLCEALTGRADSEDTLRALEANICFVVADDERTSYRYHQLFAELLRVELERRHAGMADTLHRYAAEHLEARGDITEAIGHYLAVGERDRAFDLAFASAFRRWDHDDLSAATAWLDVFPSEYIGESVERMLTYAFAVSVCGRLDEGTAWLDRAEHQLRGDPEASERNLRHADALRVLQLGSSGAPEDGIECGRRAVDAIAGGLDLGAVGDRARVNLARSQLLVDDWETAGDSIAGNDLGDSIATLLIAPAVRARVALRRGHLHEALEEAGRSLNAAVALGVPRHFGTLDALIASTGVLTERNEFADAVASIAQMHTLVDRHRDSPVYDVLVRIDQVRMAAAGGGLDDAFAVLEEAKASLGNRRMPLLQRIIDAVEARWRIESGELRRTEDLIDCLPLAWPQRELLAARLALVRGRPEETIQLIGARQFGTLRDRLAAQILVALARFQLDPSNASTAFTRAVELSAEEGFVRVFIEEGAEAARHFRIAADGLGTPAGTRLASALGAPPKPRITTPPSTVLSERESAVLRFLPSGLTNKEIASECFMSVNTVKTHLKGIYSKLGASTRSEAVDRARRLQLL